MTTRTVSCQAGCTNADISNGRFLGTVEEIHADRLSDAGRLALTFDLDLYLAEYMQCAGSFSGLYDGGAGANATADRNRRIEPYLVATEIDRVSEIFDLDKVTGQRGNQREREIAVGDSFAIGQFLRRPVGVNMNPLKISGRLGEAVNFLLVNLDPVGQSDLLALQRFSIFD